MIRTNELYSEEQLWRILYSLGPDLRAWEWATLLGVKVQRIKIILQSIEENP